MHHYDTLALTEGSPLLAKDETKPPAVDKWAVLKKVWFNELAFIVMVFSFWQIQLSLDRQSLRLGDRDRVDGPGVFAVNLADRVRIAGLEALDQIRHRRHVGTVAPTCGNMRRWPNER